MTKEEKRFAKEYKIWLEKRGFNVTIMGPEKHDELMSVVLGLTHFIALTTGEAFSKYKISELKSIGGISFKELADFSDNIINSDPDLYSSIQMELPDVIKIEKRFKKNVDEWFELVKKKDKEGFIKRMIGLKKKWKNE